MSTNTIFRVLTLMIIVLCCQFGPRIFSLIVLTLGFAHYILAFIYSRKKLMAVMSNARTSLPLLLVTVAGLILGLARAPIALASVFHHNFNEVYMRDTFKIRSEHTKHLRISCLVLNVCVFAAILRREPGIEGVNPEWLFASVAVSAVWYLAMLLVTRRHFTVRQMIDNSIYEVVSFGILAVSMVHRINFGHFVLYHFVFWTLYPVPNFIKKGPVSIATYVGLQVILLPVLWAVFAQTVTPSANFMRILFGWLAFVHIAMSLALSREQPSWVSKIFQTRVSAPAFFAAEQQTAAGMAVAVGAKD